MTQEGFPKPLARFSLGHGIRMASDDGGRLVGPTLDRTRRGIAAGDVLARALVAAYVRAPVIEFIRSLYSAYRLAMYVGD